MQKILIIEDEKRIVRTLRLYLEQAGFAVSVVYDGAKAMAVIRRERPLLILLDLNLPGQDGLDICRAVRQESDTPIIMITARTEEVDRLVGLELGGDDYILKPFSPREVVARVRAVLRRASVGSVNSNIIRAGDLRFDLAGYRVWLGEHLLQLTQTEYEILAALVRNARRVLSRLQLLEATHGVIFDGFERNIDQHIKNLRRKLKETAGDVPIIETVYGVGYRLDPVSLAETNPI